MTHRSSIALALLFAASSLGGAACSRQQTVSDLLFVPNGTTSGGIDAKNDTASQAIARTQSISLGTVVDPSAGTANSSATVASSNGSVTVVTAPPSSGTASTPPQASGPSSPVTVGVVNSNYGSLTGRGVVATAGIAR